jgi:hypothetical protein
VRLIDKDELEDRAAAMVVAELGALRSERRDLSGGPCGTRDFDVIFQDGHEEPLEVTTNLDSVVMTAFARTDGGAFDLPADVRRFWMISANQTYIDQAGGLLPFDRQRASELLRPLVEQLETAGETYFDTDRLAWPIGGRGPEGYEQVGRALYDLGVTRGLCADAGADNGRVSVHLGGGGSWGRSTIATAWKQLPLFPTTLPSSPRTTTPSAGISSSYSLEAEPRTWPAGH